MQDDFTNLDRYAKGELQGDDLSSFERAMRKDEELANEARFYKEMADAISLKERIKDIDLILEGEDFFEENTQQSDAKVRTMPRARTPFRWLSYAASLLVLVVAGALWFANANYSNTALAQLDTNRLGLLTETNTRNDNVTADVFAEGINAFKLEDYEAAAAFFAKVPSANANYSQSLLYLAAAQVQVQDYDTATTSAEKARAATNNTKNKQKAEWLLANALVGNKETEKGQTLLQTIANNDNHAYRKDAERLQQQLKSAWRQLVF